MRPFIALSGLTIGVAIAASGHLPSSGPRSFYFDDPAGNVLEIAEGDMWPSAEA